MEGIIAKVIPILLLIGLGYGFRKRETFQESTMGEIKKMVTNFGLPSVLFLTFKNMELKREYLLVMGTTFILLYILYFLGVGLNRIKGNSHPLVPFITTGFCFGALGVPLYATVFGVENLHKFSILGVSHEFFIWFVFYVNMKMEFTKEPYSMETVKGFFTNPFILSVVLGLVFNITGLNALLSQNPMFGGIEATLQYLADLQTPLILIAIGFDLKFEQEYMKQSIKLLMTRLGVTLVFGYVFKFLVLDKIIPADPLFDYAYFTYLILPPPFSLPLFVGKYSTKEYEVLANNVVVLSTVTSVIIYMIFVLMI